MTQGRPHDHGAIAYIDLPSALSDINGSLVFNQDRLQIESHRPYRGGLVTFGGYATLTTANSTDHGEAVTPPALSARRQRHRHADLRLQAVPPP